MEKASIRYIVDDVSSAVNIYVDLLDFSVDLYTGPGFAILGRGALRLMLSAPGGTDEHGVPGGAGQAMPDGAMPTPGGWNRFSLLVEDLTAEMERLVAAGVPLRSNVITGAGGRQLLLEDPSGNLVELFEPSSTAASGTTPEQPAP